MSYDVYLSVEPDGAGPINYDWPGNYTSNVWPIFCIALNEEDGITALDGEKACDALGELLEGYSVLI